MEFGLARWLLRWQSGVYIVCKSYSNQCEITIIIVWGVSLDFVSKKSIF